MGIDEGIMANRGSATQVIDLKRRTAIPGLNDSHIHLIRGGLNFNLGCVGRSCPLRMLKDQGRYEEYSYVCSTQILGFPP
ncbi:hypothetical protein D3C87_1952210 [compost metagenome]